MDKNPLTFQGTSEDVFSFEDDSVEEGEELEKVCWVVVLFSMCIFNISLFT
jgi:hypothetical protein